MVTRRPHGIRAPVTVGQRQPVDVIVMPEACNQKAVRDGVEHRRIADRVPRQHLLADLDVAHGLEAILDPHHRVAGEGVGGAGLLRKLGEMGMLL